MHFKDLVHQHKNIHCGDKMFIRIEIKVGDAENKQATYIESDQE